MKQNGRGQCAKTVPRVHSLVNQSTHSWTDFSQLEERWQGNFCQKYLQELGKGGIINIFKKKSVSKNEREEKDREERKEAGEVRFGRALKERRQVPLKTDLNEEKENI